MQSSNLTSVRARRRGVRGENRLHGGTEITETHGAHKMGFAARSSRLESGVRAGAHPLRPASRKSPPPPAEGRLRNPCPSPCVSVSSVPPCDRPRGLRHLRQLKPA